MDNQNVAYRWHGLSLEAQERVAKEFNFTEQFPNGFMVARDITDEMVWFGELYTWGKGEAP
tara:strand:- start:2146 stop:2328 length:183 start_codon:yes stop_codon:yes gene_type:complete